MVNVKVRIITYRQVVGAFGVQINRAQREYIEGELTDDELEALRKQLSKRGRSNA